MMTKERYEAFLEDLQTDTDNLRRTAERWLAAKHGSQRATIVDEECQTLRWPSPQAIVRAVFLKNKEIVAIRGIMG